MLEQEQRVGALAAPARGDQLVLELERLAIPDLPELAHLEQHAGHP